MLLKNALSKLDKHGFDVQSNLGSYVATRKDVVIKFFEQNGKTSKFSFEDENASAPTFGISLNMALEFAYL